MTSQIVAPTPRQQLTRRGLAGLLSLILAVVTLGFVAPTAYATTGISASLLLNGDSYEGTPVVTEGDTLTLRLQYTDQVAPGSTVEFELGDNVTLTTVPSGNTAIASVVKDGNKVRITFADPWPNGVNQGVSDLKFTVNAVDESTKDKITWKIDGEESSRDVIIRNSGDEFANVTNGQSKNLSPDNRSNVVSVSSDGVVSLSTGVIGSTLTTYTLRVTSAEARNGLTIADQLPANLAYLAASFSAQLTTWDADGLNRETNPFAFSPTITGNSFTSSVDLPADSILVITYAVTVPDEAARLALQTQLQAAADARNGDPGNFSVSLQNTASFGTENRSATLQLTGTLPAAPGPTPGSAFGKTSDWTTQELKANADGTLTPPEDITYTLHADLAQWDGRPDHANYTLTRNIVIRDALPVQASWNTTDPAFLTVSGNLALAPAADGVACTDAAMAVDAQVGTYCVSGQVLLINVGKDSGTSLDIAVKAQVNTVTGLPDHSGGTTIKDGHAYRLRNTAQFTYRDGSPYTVNRDAKIVTLPEDTSNGINDSSVFTKQGTTDDAAVDPGDTVTMHYTFTVAAGKGIDVRTSRIVDYIDDTIFDLSDPSAIDISGTYDGQALNSTHFVTSIDADKDLVIALSDAGKAVVTTRGADKRLVVNIALTTVPFEGKETRTITNRATLFGEDGDPDYWSESSLDATSYGDEAEVRKTVYDRGDEAWVQTLKAQRDAGGQLTQSVFTYRVEFIPHGDYDSVVIADVRDVLPSGVSFLGFVTAANAATAENPVAGPVDIGGNIEATYSGGVVTLRQKDGTVLDAGESIAAYFAVQVVDPSAVVPIVNQIGTTRAEIVPISYAVGDYVWIDADRDGVQDAGEDVLPGVTVDLLNAAGEVVATTTTDAQGRYLFDGLPAGTYQVRFTLTEEQAARYTFTTEGAGDSDADDSDAVVQTGGRIGLTRQFVLDGTNTALTGDYDREVQASEGIDPTWDAGVVLKSVSVGDYVWVDSNRDGRQDPGEPGIPGVVLELVGPDGEPVTDVHGNPVGPVTTGPNGEYTFENLPALSGEQTYTVRIDTEASAEALRPYVPTSPSQGDRQGDSSSWEAMTEPGDLHEDGDRDPTLDFGFVAKTYAIGDYVWIDANRDGSQGDDEDPLPGVRVDLLDSDGHVIATTTTDDAGRYLFDNLEAGTYQVRFTLTDKQKKTYRFTSRDSGDDAADSDADRSTGLTTTIVLGEENTALTKEYEYGTVNASEGIDPTWDAGVILRASSSDGSDDDGDDSLAYTGVSAGLWGLGIAGIALVLVGIGLRRRRQQA
ncbi:SdrD B-like domain-containing protein [Propionicimonas sp.]|uniref:SdrD B-like domain-containing protein n=1 Tax=Propionicimonas sp. TaxID=1955623 RepID=UPI0039E58187